MRLSGSETVLAVDDDPVMLELVEQVLRPLGYKVLFASSGEEALKVAASHQEEKIDLLLTDVILPGIKGQELAKQLLDSSCPDVNVLFMSGYICPSMAHNDSGQGFEGFIQKPFAPKSLLRKMRKLLD
jgi:two-component system cell cycle sensor histidine kinase/response regulator CckA